MLYNIIFPLLCLAFMAYVLRLVSKGRLTLKYSLLWLVLSVAMLLICLFSKQVGDFTYLLGFKVFSNFVFVAGLCFLLIITLALSSIVSKQASAIKTLTQRLALAEKQIEELRESSSASDTPSI
ncbi:DUF2304 domain-containing protein [Olsenella uli]|uniref:DUF2304 domain-containing protein n=1 Tax=Olsenella uli TaxID=133926 RepID=UPI00195D9303|nr:DUF2304 domain-containing protein [Olsenella uli]MBM6817618.1 DUF2304 domain-containing protein [Olsenella uli]